jgi:hypothetical protein
MSRDKHAVEVMKATGCRYTTALVEVRRRYKLRQLGAYMTMVRATPAANAGEERCVRCLAPIHGRCDR